MFITRFFFLLGLLFLASSCSDSGSGQLECRPQVHFSTEDKMDIPAALVYSERGYHLFYLTDKSDTKKFDWGHAVSADLVQWETQPAALLSDSLFSLGPGSVVIDVKNTSGLGIPDNPPWIAIFTCSDLEKLHQGENDVQTQALAYSLDRGNTWTAYSGNPIIPNPGFSNFKDPKVFWYEPEEYWVMVVATEGRIIFYTSPDLKYWTKTSHFGFDRGASESLWERPDLFEIPIENGEENRWILTINIEMDSNKEWVTGFYVGKFDGKTFDTEQLLPYQFDFGNDNYGGTTFTNLPNGRSVWMGWMNHRKYADILSEYPWCTMLTIPRELHLEKMSSGYILKSLPVEERTVLHSKKMQMQNIEVKQDVSSSGIVDITSKIKFPIIPSEINICFKPNPQWLGLGAAEKFGIRLRNQVGEYIEIGYNVYYQFFYIDRTHSTSSFLPEIFSGIHVQPYFIEEAEMMDMQIILDTASLELFSMTGRVILTDLYFSSVAFNKIELFAENGKIYTENISITQLKSIL